MLILKFPFRILGPFGIVGEPAQLKVLRTLLSFSLLIQSIYISLLLLHLNCT